jgi:hypothetical protein
VLADVDPERRGDRDDCECDHQHQTWAAVNEGSEPGERRPQPSGLRLEELDQDRGDDLR